jgi:hypothetical protein
MDGLADEIKAMNELDPVDDKGTQTPSTESPGTSSPATQGPSTEGPTTEAPIDPYETLTKRLAELEDRLEKANKKRPVTEAPSTDAPIELQDFVSDLDDEDLGDSLTKEKLNKILNAVYEAGVKTSRSQATEGILRKLPGVVRNNVSTYVALTEATRQFYIDNPDLKAHAAKVAEVYESFAAENMDKPVQELFEQLGDKARSVLKLQKVAKTTAPTLPGGTKKKSGPKEPVKLSGIMAEIEAMNALED